MRVKGYPPLTPPRKRMYKQTEDHRNCPQAQYQRTNRNTDNYYGSQSQSETENVSGQSYTGVVRGDKPGYTGRYNVPTYNLYDSLNC